MTMQLRNLRQYFRLLAVLGALHVSVSTWAADETVTGNLTVTGNASVGGVLTTTGAANVGGNLVIAGGVDAAGNELTLGDQGGTFGLGAFFLPAGPDGVRWQLTRVSAWLWEVNNGGTVSPSMRLDAANSLLLYSGGTAGVTLDPVAKSLSLGDAVLYRDASGALKTDGALTVGGTFTATIDSLTGGSNGLALNAGGTNQNVTITPTGTGRTILNSDVGIGTSVAGAGRLTIQQVSDTSAGGLRIQNSDNSSAMRLWKGASSAASVVTDNGVDTIAFKSGNVGIGTSVPASRLHVEKIGSTTWDPIAEFRSSASDGRLLVSGFAVGADEDRVGFVWEDQGNANMRMWMGNNRYLYSSEADPSNSLNGRRFIQEDTSGNVGIGTTSPEAAVHLQRSSPGATTTLFIDNSAPSTLNNAAAIRFAVDAGATVTNGGAQIAAINTDANNGATALAFTNFSGASNVETMRISPNGNVGIGTTTPTHKLAVNGTIKAKEVLIDSTGWADYVFEADYRLAPLAEVEQHIREKKHLPGIPSAAEVATQGVSLGDMQAKLLSKIEELTLHLIRLEQEHGRLRERMQKLEAQAPSLP